MTIYILSIIVLISLILYVKRKIAETSYAVEKKVNQIKTVVTHPNLFVTIVGRILLAQALGKISKIFRR